MKKHIILLTTLLLSVTGISKNQNKEVKSLLENIVSKGNVMGVVAGYSVNGKTIDQGVAGYSNKKENKNRCLI